MKTSDAIDQLATALAAAQAEMPDAVFDRNNPHFKSKYASLASVRKATQALHKHGIAVVHAKEFLADGAYILITRLIHGKSGQWIESEWPLAIGTPQAMGSSETYGRRYNLSGLTSVAADDDDDANAAEDAVKDVAGVTLGTLNKTKSRPIYAALIQEMRAITSLDALADWERANRPRIRSMHPDAQAFFNEDYDRHDAALRAEGDTDEEGQTVGETIGDAIPQEGGGDASAEEPGASG